MKASRSAREELDGHAIFKQNPPGSKEYRGFLLAVVVLSF